jgi:hypothetical protein
VLVAPFETHRFAMLLRVRLCWSTLAEPLNFC